MRLRCLAFCSLLLLSTTTVWAQDRVPPASVTSDIAKLSPEAQSATEWPVAHAHGLRTVDVVLALEPGVRHRCRVKALTDSEIQCKRRLHAATRYSRSDVAAIILPAHNSTEILPLSLFLSFQGGVGYGLYLLGGLSLGAAVPLAVLVGFFTVMMIGMSAEETVPDQVVYARTGAPLSVKLH